MTETGKEGVLRCEHCGQTFLVTDGELITIDHFQNCEGLEE